MCNIRVEFCARLKRRKIGVTVYYYYQIKMTILHSKSWKSEIHFSRNS